MDRVTAIGVEGYWGAHTIILQLHTKVTILSKGDSSELWYRVVQLTPNFSTHQCVPFLTGMRLIITVKWTIERDFLCLLDEHTLKHQLLSSWLTPQQKVNNFHIHWSVERQSWQPSFIWWLCGFITHVANGDDKIHASQNRKGTFWVGMQPSSTSQI